MRGETLLLVDDEKLIRWSLRQELTKRGFGVLEAATMTEALSRIERENVDLIILDQNLPDGTGIDFLQSIRKSGPIMPVVMLTAIDRSDIAVQAMKLGAFDYVTKPVNMDEMVIVIEKALESTKLKRQVAHFLKEQEKQFGFCGMIGASDAIRRVFDDVTKIAQTRGTTVLITGESGTGKELVAKAIHFLSDRRERPLMVVNCSALTENLIETELFGHEKGAFTDARSQKKGIFELADTGTIFLDEIGDISPKLQVRLLRVIEQKSFQRVGGTSEITVDVRVITATNRPLAQYVAEGTFREDLFYRLNVATLHMPPLRERGGDVALLAEYFIQEFNVKFQKRFSTIVPEARRMLMEYHWPGNVRELRNVLERAILLGDGNAIEPRHIELNRFVVKEETPSGTGGRSGDDLSLFEMERQALLRALEKSAYNQSQAARLLKISRDTLRYRMKKFNISPPDQQ
ncbi:MAG TPA: sigma-54 dependent transcriptional regulator [Bacteroidota bacterium]|nr:sigma-54 dependent transcriptional regulator [Bacteroidota bacterium]